jgi:hypothetical protein
MKALFDYIKGGDSLDEFLDDFLAVSRSQAVRLLETAAARITGSRICEVWCRTKLGGRQHRGPARPA